MSSLANDREIQHLMRDFVMCCNRAENAEAKGAEGGVLDAMHEQRRNAATVIEEALLGRGWAAPTGPRPVQLPETAAMTTKR